MSLLSELGSILGGHQDAQRIAAGQGDYQDPSSPDAQRMQAMVSRADPQHLQQVFTQAAQRMDPQEYDQHITPGAGGTNPLAGLGAGGLSTIASALIRHLTGGAGGGSGGGMLSGMLSRIPGLSTTDPRQMDENQVAALARYTQQNDPQAFGRAAAQVGQQRPDLLHSFLGKAGLAIGAAALASHFIGRSQQQQQ